MSDLANLNSDEARAFRELEWKTIWTAVRWIRIPVMIGFLFAMIVYGAYAHTRYDVGPLVCGLIIGELAIYNLAVPVGIFIGSMAYFMVGWQRHAHSPW